MSNIPMARTRLNYIATLIKDKKLAIQINNVVLSYMYREYKVPRLNKRRKRK